MLTFATCPCSLCPCVFWACNPLEPFTNSQMEAIFAKEAGRAVKACRPVDVRQNYPLVDSTYGSRAQTADGMDSFAGALPCMGCPAMVGLGGSPSAFPCASAGGTGKGKSCLACLYFSTGDCICT